MYGAGFRGAGLVPYDPEAVLSKLDVRLRTPTPPAPGTVAWEAQTPRHSPQQAIWIERID
jgi:hypothetical protein